MGSRTSLQTLLEGILSSQHVYFQPPESVKLEYPCIVYGRNTVNKTFADNSAYSHKICYTVTLIDRNPDSSFLGKLIALPLCKFDRHYKKDNLNHDAFSLYY